MLSCRRLNEEPRYEGRGIRTVVDGNLKLQTSHLFQSSFRSGSERDVVELDCGVVVADPYAWFYAAFIGPREAHGGEEDRVVDGAG